MDANVIFGLCDGDEETVTVTVIATGIEEVGIPQSLPSEADDEPGLKPSALDFVLRPSPNSHTTQTHTRTVAGNTATQRTAPETGRKASAQNISQAAAKGNEQGSINIPVFLQKKGGK